MPILERIISGDEFDSAARTSTLSNMSVESSLTRGLSRQDSPYPADIDNSNAEPS